MGQQEHAAEWRYDAELNPMAPSLIQARYIGYPYFTGLPFIDDLIAEDIVTPTSAENLFTETLLRVEG
ncbi:MAG: hypothetical protein VX639_06400 [Pseudomonadota bacterium]|nr:hypothetical protein [Pseudomonadota bacterium]